MSTITGIFGLQGSGKTMLMTFFGVREQKKGKTVYANYHLKQIPYVSINTLEDIDKIKKGVFLIDECWLWVFARSSMSKMNQEMMKIVMLNRKRDVDIYYTAQLSRSVDVLLKEVTNYWVYPSIRPFSKGGVECEDIKFRLCFLRRDLCGRIVSSGEFVLPKDLSYYGGFYDTTEEITVLTKGENEDDVSFQKGIQLEETFSKALSKMKCFNHVEVLPNSGSTTTWGFDVIAYADGKTFAFDVKGVCKNRVYLNAYGKTLKDKIQNAKSHNAIPYIAFPRNDRVQLTNPEFWYVFPLNHYSYLLKLSSDPAYEKLVEHSERLAEMQ
jgi:Holliday junction resolvase